MKILENSINGFHENSTKEIFAFGRPGSGKTGFFPSTNIFIQPGLRDNSFLITHAKDEIGMTNAFARWSSMTPEEKKAEYASNNWRRMHGYPLRHKEANRRRKEFSTEKMWFETFDRMEKNGWTLQFNTPNGVGEN